jgi:hypothetical protein
MEEQAFTQNISVLVLRPFEESIVGFSVQLHLPIGSLGMSSILALVGLGGQGTTTTTIALVC